MQAYAHKIGQCLAEADQRPASPATALLQKWTCELNLLRVFLAMGHLKKYLSFLSVRLDGEAGPSAPQLNDAWYHELLVGSCSVYTSGGFCACRCFCSCCCLRLCLCLGLWFCFSLLSCPCLIRYLKFCSASDSFGSVWIGMVLACFTSAGCQVSSPLIVLTLMAHV